MGRPRIIKEEELIQLIDRFYCEFCADGVHPIKLPELAAYVAEHGYPDYAVTTLRRDKIAREHIENLQSNSKEAKLATLTAFQTLDINTFLDTHTSRASLASALSSRDQYYREIAGNAVQFTKEHKALTDEIASLKGQRDAAFQEVNRAHADLVEAKQEIQALKRKARDLEAVINKYIIPDIAKTILVRDGIIPFSAGIVSGDEVDNNMITASTNIHMLGERRNIEHTNESQGNCPSGADDVLEQFLQQFQ